MVLFALTGLIVLQLSLAAAVVFFLARAVRLAASAPDSPFVPTPPSYAKAVLASLRVHNGDIVYDLGSGDGRLLIRCAKLAPHASFVGIEYSRTLHLLAQARKLLSGNPKNVRFRRADLYETDVSEATKIYVFLLSSMLNKLLPSLERDFKGTLVSRAFPFAKKDPARGTRVGSRKGLYNQHVLYVYEF